MSRSTQPPLSEAQLEIMNVVWDRGEATVAEVWKALAARRKVARNTVQTMIARLEERGWLKRRGDGPALLRGDRRVVLELRARQVAQPGVRLVWVAGLGRDVVRVTGGDRHAHSYRIAAHRSKGGARTTRAGGSHYDAAGDGWQPGSERHQSGDD